eukprot:jgi/Chlat1/3950/Chrsp26S04035
MRRRLGRLLAQRIGEQLCGWNRELDAGVRVGAANERLLKTCSAPQVRGSRLNNRYSGRVLSPFACVSPLLQGYSSHRSSEKETEHDGHKQAGSSQREFTHASASAPGLLQRHVPLRLWPYVQLARLDKPVGTWLLYWPCTWSIAMAAAPGSLPDVKLLTLFGMGALLMRGAGCTVNDLLDRKFDRQVERTRDRPLASGALTPMQGGGFLVAQLLAALSILLQLNDYSKVLGASSVLLVGTYPLMKRVTDWPQAYLGLTFNWGALLGWAAVRGTCDWSVVLPMYAAGICWTLVYDTIYAHQDKYDDALIGVKSTALRFGDRTPIWLTGFTACTVAGLAAAGSAAQIGWPFYAAVAAGGAHLGWQVATVNIHNRDDCAAKFASNKWFGAVICTGAVLGRLYQ